jgi:hypothetical protein
MSRKPSTTTAAADSASSLLSSSSSSSSSSSNTQQRLYTAAEMERLMLQLIQRTKVDASLPSSDDLTLLFEDSPERQSSDINSQVLAKGRGLGPGRGVQAQISATPIHTVSVASAGGPGLMIPPPQPQHSVTPVAGKNRQASHLSRVRGELPPGAETSIDTVGAGTGTGAGAGAGIGGSPNNIFSREQKTSTGATKSFQQQQQALPQWALKQTSNTHGLLANQQEWMPVGGSFAAEDGNGRYGYYGEVDAPESSVTVSPVPKALTGASRLQVSIPDSGVLDANSVTEFVGLPPTLTQPYTGMLSPSSEQILHNVAASIASAASRAPHSAHGAVPHVPGGPAIGSTGTSTAAADDDSTIPISPRNAWGQIDTYTMPGRQQPPPREFVTSPAVKKTARSRVPMSSSSSSNGTSSASFGTMPFAIGSAAAARIAASNGGIRTSVSQSDAIYKMFHAGATGDSMSPEKPHSSMSASSRPIFFGSSPSSTSLTSNTSNSSNRNKSKGRANSKRSKGNRTKSKTKSKTKSNAKSNAKSKAQSNGTGKRTGKGQHARPVSKVGSKLERNTSQSALSSASSTSKISHTSVSVSSSVVRRSMARPGGLGNLARLNKRLKAAKKIQTWWRRQCADSKSVRAAPVEDLLIEDLESIHSNSSVARLSDATSNASVDALRRTVPRAAVDPRVKAALLGALIRFRLRSKKGRELRSKVHDVEECISDFHNRGESALCPPALYMEKAKLKASLYELVLKEKRPEPTRRAPSAELQDLVWYSDKGLQDFRQPASQVFRSKIRNVAQTSVDEESKVPAKKHSYLKRRSQKVSPQKLDWSHIAPRTENHISPSIRRSSSGSFRSTPGKPTRPKSTKSSKTPTNKSRKSPSALHTSATVTSGMTTKRGKVSDATKKRRERRKTQPLHGRKVTKAIEAGAKSQVTPAGKKQSRSKQKKPSISPAHGSRWVRPSSAALSPSPSRRSSRQHGRPSTAALGRNRLRRQLSNEEEAAQSRRELEIDSIQEQISNFRMGSLRASNQNIDKVFAGIKDIQRQVKMLVGQSRSDEWTMQVFRSPVSSPTSSIDHLPTKSKIPRLTAPHALFAVGDEPEVQACMESIRRLF